MAETTASSKHANRLIHETSPYLLQHAHNPVDWYPWGDEALTRAKTENTLILLSIGYSACHWCHVMERESFESEEIAAVMNEHFVNIKVDREERPDLDDIYMAATVAMNHGQGGWPMTVFLTPELEPVFAGTYFPPDDRYGRPGFLTVLNEIARAWREDKDQLRRNASVFTERLRAQRAPGPAIPVGEDELRATADAYAKDFDARYGGFGPAPKFPPAVGLRLLLRLYERFGDDRLLSMVEKTLEAMARGGIYDQVGGGFCRYATDERWLVPHFEKMLYDNALLTAAYLEAFQVTRKPLYRRIARETLEYVLREMTSPEGGFYSSTDADSEGEEGKFFVWRPDEVVAVLGPDEGELFNAFYDITDAGNWEGTSIPNVPRAIEEFAQRRDAPADELQVRLMASRDKLYAARAARVKPGLDDKVLTAWNGLMIGALADGYRVLGDRRYLDAAVRAAEFVLTTLSREDGSLLRTYRNQTAHLNAYLEDYAYLAEGLIDLFEAGGSVHHLREAGRLCERMLDQFGDEDAGALYTTSRDHEQLIMRYRDGTDGATPSANAVAASALARLSYHLDRVDFRQAAVGAIKAYGQGISRFPRGFAKSLMVTDFLLQGPVELVIAGTPGSPDFEALRAALAVFFIPRRIQGTADPDANDAQGLPMLEGKGLVNDAAALYVCRNFTCEAPITDPTEVEPGLWRDHGDDRRTIGMRLPGFGTGDGTASFARRFPSTGYTPLGSTGLTVSRLGFGAYRVDDVFTGHREALTRALLGGVNLIDTSTNYTDGGSERLIGSIVNELVDSGEVTRAEFVVVSKIGYVQGTNYQHAQEREARGEPFPGMVKIQDGLWHCLHPAFLEEQLQRSLDRLQLDTLDVCLLHNPEYYLAEAARSGKSLDVARAEFYRRLTEAFRYFEIEVAAGRLRWYGVSSNTLVLPAAEREATSLSRLLESAVAAAGADHHFRVVQVPLNLFEAGAVFERNTGPDETRTVLEEAQAHELAVLVNRPLNAFQADGMVRLADVSVSGAPVDIEEQRTKMVELERVFADRIAPELPGVEDSTPAGEYFKWADELKRLAEQSFSLEQWAQLAGQVQQRVGQITRVLDHHLWGDNASRWTNWRDRYFTELGIMLGELRRRAAERAKAVSERITAAIDPHLPAERRGATLSQKALWVAASTPGVTCALNGMRSAEYVRDSLAVLEWETLDAVAPIYQAARDAVPDDSSSR